MGAFPFRKGMSKVAVICLYRTYKQNKTFMPVSRTT